MSHQSDDDNADVNVIFGIIVIVSCALVVLTAIIVAIHYIRSNSLASKANYIKVPTTINSSTQHLNHENTSYYNTSTKDIPKSNVLDRKASASKVAHKKCQCDTDLTLPHQVHNNNNNDNNNIRPNHNRNELGRDNSSRYSNSRSVLYPSESQQNVHQVSDDLFGDQPALITSSSYYPTYPGLVSLSPYQYIPYSPWGIVKHLPSTNTNPNHPPCMQRNQVMNISKPLGNPQIKTFKDKSSQYVQSDNQPAIVSSSSSSLSLNNSKADSNYSILEDRKRIRHGVRLNIKLTEHERMMQELHSRALERIHRLNDESKKYYQLDVQ